MVWYQHGCQYLLIPPPLSLYCLVIHSLRKNCEHHLHSLDIRESLDKLVLWTGLISCMHVRARQQVNSLVQTVHAGSEQEVGGNVEGHAVEQVHHVNRFPRDWDFR